MNRFEYSLLAKEWKAQTDIAKKKQSQNLDDTYEFDKIIKKSQHLRNIIYQI